MFYGLGKLRGAGLALLILGALSGCATNTGGVSGRPLTVSPPDMAVLPPPFLFSSGSLGVCAFAAPPHAPQTGAAFADSLSREILRRGAAARVVPLPEAAGPGEALSAGRRAGVDLVLFGAVTRLLDGSGGIPTECAVRAEARDTRSGAILLDGVLRAASQPGWDIDLFWHTIPGGPAAGAEDLVTALAECLAGVLSPPPEPAVDAKTLTPGANPSDTPFGGGRSATP